MKPTLIAIAAASLMSSGVAEAQSATDAQCLLLSNAFAAQSKDANAQKTAEASLYFYLGRIRDQSTAAQLKPLFDAQAKTITQANAGTLMDACVKKLQDNLQLIHSLAQPPKAPAK